MTSEATEGPTVTALTAGRGRGPGPADGLAEACLPLPDPWLW
jgi:hypothetical protein